jgi:hypothetical protein
VLIDLDLTSNEVLLFDKEQCAFCDKSKLRDTMRMTATQTRPDFGPFIEGKETFGNTLRAKIAARTGLVSPTAKQQSTSSRYGDFDETKSTRSATRSLAIAVPKTAQAQQPLTARAEA